MFKIKNPNVLAYQIAINDSIVLRRNRNYRLLVLANRSDGVNHLNFGPDNVLINCKGQIDKYFKQF